MICGPTVQKAIKADEITFRNSRKMPPAPPRAGIAEQPSTAGVSATNTAE
jgi:hypothetical protein